ncbi:MAG: 4'-phosphopantetheinyl transferase superfamily protein, partial [Actinomycetota bacterium]
HGGRVGIDVEGAAYRPEVAGRFFLPSELERLERLERLPGDACSEEFARIWTVKEACAKVTGAGMRSLRQIEVGAGYSGQWGDLAWWATGLPHAMAALARRTPGGPAPAPVWVLLPDLECLRDLASTDLLDPPANAPGRATPR